MEFKGTKDKWGVCSANKTEVNSFNGTAIAECGMSQMATIEEREANARLIAAAPELFEACKMARTEIAKGTADTLTVDVLEKALLKALGENV